MIPLVPPTSHPVLRDPTLPFKTSKRTKSKAAVHHDGTRGTKVYHNLNMSANHVRSVGGGRHHQQQNGVRSCMIGKKNKYDKNGNLRMKKFTQAHLETNNFPDDKDQSIDSKIKKRDLPNDTPKGCLLQTSISSRKRKSYTSFENTTEHDHHMHIEAFNKEDCTKNGNHEHEEKHQDEENDNVSHHGGDEHSDIEIDYDQQLYDYRSTSQSPLHHQHRSHIITSDPDEEEVNVPNAIDMLSPLPLCPPRHGGRKYLYEYESLDVERGLLRLPGWLCSRDRKNALHTLLEERFSKRYPVSWKKGTHVPVYNPKHYADAF